LKNNTVFECAIVNLSKVHNSAGNITVLENGSNIPFEVKRIYYLYDVPGGEGRGGHAHYNLEQYIVAASGAFDVVLDDGTNKRRVTLNRPYVALHIVPGLWRELENFSSGSISLVLASQKYTENDYIRNYQEFLNLKK
jgi:hypothetical protein|tara:strand:+ start:869 stop:1282 length:414 start_codon:yes stop_codon:yes gene_type:complete